MVFNKKFMQKKLFGAVLLGLAGCARGQGTAETMLQQIAALQTYARVAQQGYEMTEQGLATIRAIRQGEFDLHTLFFHSLSTVSPAVKNMPAMSAIQLLMTLRPRARWAPGWQQELDELTLLTTDGALQMTDGERIRRILAIETAIRARYGL
jgi:hypothetical protein